MIKTFINQTKKLLPLLAVLFWLPLSAQIYEPDGLRMPGSWNDWTNEPNMGGDFELQKAAGGTARWITSFQHDGESGVQQFKFVSTSFSDPWGNQWAGNENVSLNAESNFVYGTPSDPDNSIQLQQNYWYTVVYRDNGYENTSAIFMETAAQPVTFTEVIQEPVLVTAMQPVSIIATLSAAPSASEKLFLRYSTDDWETASLLDLSVNGAQATATIPGQVSQTEVEYYVFSSVLEDPAADPDFYSLRYNNNGGANFSYIVDQTFDCGGYESLVSSDPAFPLANQSVTIFFNAAYGNGGLFDYEGDIYVHTGLITNESTNSSDWKYVKTEWGENTPETKLERLEDNIYSLTIADMRSYYGIPATESIEKLAFVFRSDVENADGNFLEQKNADGSDIFVEVYPLSLQVKIISPNRKEPLVSPNSVLPVCVEAMENSSISLYVDAQLLGQENASSISFPLLLQELEPGAHWLKASATDGTAEVRDSVQIYLRPPVEVEELPEGFKNGVNYLSNTSVGLVLNDAAGLKQFAFAIGEFSNWLPNDDNYMKRTPDGQHYWVILDGLQNSKEYAYQYYVDGQLKIADPYSEKILDPWNDRWIPVETYPNLKPYPFDKTIGIASVFQTNQTPYDWQITDFVPAAVNETQSDLLIYELLLRDFDEAQNIKAATDKLDYLKTLGVNAIQLMPIIEFDGNESWGYAPNFFFATDKYYGTKAAYQAFVDAAHARDMAVILDIVPNHAFGQSPMVQLYFNENAGDHGEPSLQNPWFNPQAKHPFSVGYDFNHGSPATRQYFKDVFAHWLAELKVDGFRIDLSKGLTQNYSGDDVGAWSTYDQSRIDILTDYYNHIKSVNPNAYVILEHFADNSEETVLANTGMMLWSGMHNTYKQVAMGWNESSDFSWAYHAERGWNYPNLIDYMENHDEERMMSEALQYGNSSGDYNIQDTLTALRHQQQAMVLFMSVPGPKMLWQFEEMGYDYSIFYGDDRLAPKPPRWDYLLQLEREQLSRVTAAMAALRKTDAFRFGSLSKSLQGDGKRLWISHSSMDVVVAANMGVSSFEMSPGFTKTGSWYNYFTGEEMVVNDVNMNLNFGPGDYYVFTSVPMPQPFYTVNVKVLDEETGLPIEDIDIRYNSAVVRSSDDAGEATFTAMNGSYTITAEKFGWLSQSQTGELSNELQLTFELERDLSNLAEQAKTNKLRFYPNPANEQLTVENTAGAHIRIYNLQGQLLLERLSDKVSTTLSLARLKPGTYLLMLLKEQQVLVDKLIVR